MSAQLLSRVEAYCADANITAKDFGEMIGYDKVVRRLRTDFPFRPTTIARIEAQLATKIPRREELVVVRAGNSTSERAKTFSNQIADASQRLLLAHLSYHRKYNPGSVYPPLVHAGIPA